MRRLGAAVVVLAAAAALTGLLAPDPRNPPLDPSLDLRAVAEVPAPVGDLLRQACMDCHSDETRWPWYARVPPAGWLVSHDVREARGQMNFSRWGEYNSFDRADMLDEACEQVTSGEMPLWSYRLLHPRARLSDAQRTALCEWTRAEAERTVQE